MELPTLISSQLMILFMRDGTTSSGKMETNKSIDSIDSTLSRLVDAQSMRSPSLELRQSIAPTLLTLAAPSLSLEKLRQLSSLSNTLPP